MASFYLIPEADAKILLKEKLKLLMPLLLVKKTNSVHFNFIL